MQKTILMCKMRTKLNSVMIGPRLVSMAQLRQGKVVVGNRLSLAAPWTRSHMAPVRLNFTAAKSTRVSLLTERELYLDKSYNTYNI